MTRGSRVGSSVGLVFVVLGLLSFIIGLCDVLSAALVFIVLVVSVRFFPPPETETGGLLKPRPSLGS